MTQCIYDPINSCSNHYRRTGAQRRQQLRCGHIFCAHCLQQLMRAEQNHRLGPKCPICRRSINGVLKDVNSLFLTQCEAVEYLFISNFNTYLKMITNHFILI